MTQLRITVGRWSLGVLALVVLSGADSASAGDYYVDCDGNPGAGPGPAPVEVWTSLDTVNQAWFEPDDRILLRRGSECVGRLRPRGSGTPGHPIVLAAYGVGPRPVVRAGASTDAVLRLSDQEHWEIRNLEIVGGTTYGIHVTGVENRPLRGLRIVDTLVRDVTGAAVNKESGLVVVSPGSPGTVFKDVVIDGVEAYGSTQWAGILVGGDDFGGTPSSPRSSDVTVRNSLIHHVAGDGIVLYQVDRGLLEKNVVYETGLAPDTSVGTPNGIWTWMCHDCVVQFNEGYRTHSPGVDGGVYDIDYGCSDNVVQYNYAHDADGYCVSVFGAYWPTTNSVVRYNVCANNGRDPLKVFQGDLYLLTWGGGSIEGVEVYNNTVFWNPSANAYAIHAYAYGSGGISAATFKNNILVSTVPMVGRLGARVESVFDHNLYWYDGAGAMTWESEGQVVTSLAGWQSLGYDTQSRFLDPMLMGSDLTAASVPRRSFMLQAGSPAIDGGTPMHQPESAEFWGNAPDIGAYEWVPHGLRGGTAQPLRRAENR